MRARLFAALLAGAVAACAAAPSTWLEKVAPTMSPAEKKTYLAMAPEARASFEEAFWSTRSVTAEEYYRRLNYVDAMWGSDKPGSGANTDPGRVYLAIGAPTRLMRLPSSRTFVPLEIWYYDNVPGVIATELRLLFYKQNSQGLPKLYSPITDTMRALLVPQAGTVHAFGPNQSMDETALRNVLKVGAGEDEVITAAASIAPGIKGSGNQEILALVTSPEAMLSRTPKTRVTSRLVSAKAQLETFVSASGFGGAQVDIRVRTSAMKEIVLEILAGDGSQGQNTLAQNRVQLGFPSMKPIEYTHRVDLLSGSYRLLFTADGATSAFALEVPEHVGMSGIIRLDRGNGTGGLKAPFEFAGMRYDVNPEGGFALLATPVAGRVVWTVRKGSDVVWRSVESAGPTSIVELPRGLAAGEYRLEAVTADDSRSLALNIGAKSSTDASTSVSYNANLAPALRYAFVGTQWLMRGRRSEARAAVEASLRVGRTVDAEVTMARIEALEGQLDGARDRVRGVLNANPNHFEALTVFAFVETQFQDYTVAARLYRRALAVQDSAALRAALASLPAPGR